MALDPSPVVPLATITQEAQFLGHVFELLIKGGLGKTKRLCTLNPCSPTQSECITVKQNKTKGWKTLLRMSKDRCLSQCQLLGLPYLSGRTGRGWRVSSHLSTPTGIHLLRPACRADLRDFLRLLTEERQSLVEEEPEQNVQLFPTQSLIFWGHIFHLILFCSGPVL